MFQEDVHKKYFNSDKDKLRHFDMIISEADTVREHDKQIIKGLFNNFYNKSMDVGIGFQRAHGSILSGDYFDLIKLSDGNYMFVFADISGHGLPAYTTLIRLRSSIILSVNESNEIYKKTGKMDTDYIVKNITRKFTNIMDDAYSHDFACAIFTFIYNDRDKFHLKFYNRSMLFPIIVRRFQGRLVGIYNLNNNDRGWIPQKGYIMGSDIRKLKMGEYLDTPSCDFVLYEGDSIFFFSDGIVEATRDGGLDEEFGQKRLERYLRENYDISPQVVVHELFQTVYDFIGTPGNQKDDMTAVFIEFPPVRY